MKKGVIYARYSSDRQNEQSIVGQVEVCTKWADNNDIEVVNVYHDEALTGKSDKRPAFQKMIKDAKSGNFDYIIVYKLDRFARNRYDSAVYKAQLKKHGVRIMSAMESIADGPEGIILESVLEGMAEYYSANLAQNVVRGMRQQAEKGKYMGGVAPLGYKIDDDKNYVIDDKTAVVVKQIYQKYAEGYSLRKICQDLNEAGYKTSKGGSFIPNSVRKILSNPKYIGRYECMGVVIDNAVPSIIDRETFEAAQQRIQSNKKSLSSSKSNINFHLTGKLFCGECGGNMVGDSGTSKTGDVHYYYSCTNKKRRKGCTKKAVRKEWIERLVTDITINQILTDETIKHIAKQTFECYEKEKSDNSMLISLKKALSDIQKTIDNIMDAIEQGIITDTTKERLLNAEEQKKDIIASIENSSIKKPSLTEEQIVFFLDDIRNKVYDSDEQIEVIIRTFVNAVYLYDDKIIITYNIKENEKLKKIELSELEKFGQRTERKTIVPLSELFMFAVIINLRSR